MKRLILTGILLLAACSFFHPVQVTPCPGPSQNPQGPIVCIDANAQVNPATPVHMNRHTQIQWFGAAPFRIEFGKPTNPNDTSDPNYACPSLEANYKPVAGTTKAHTSSTGVDGDCKYTVWVGSIKNDPIIKVDPVP